MADWGVRLSKLAQFLATAGTVPDTAISTAETDTDLVLRPDGAGGVEFAAEAGGGGVTVLSPSSDTYIDVTAATTNNDTSTTLLVGNIWNTASFTRYALLSFDVTALAGKTIGSAFLHLYRTDSTAAGATDRILEARRVIRDYVPTEVTWNIYSTGNNWTTAGARSVGNDIELARSKGDQVGAAADVDEWHRIDVAALLQVTLDASETELRLIVSSNVNGAGSNSVQFASLNHGTAGLRPKLRVTHS